MLLNHFVLIRVMTLIAVCYLHLFIRDEMTIIAIGEYTIYQKQNIGNVNIIEIKMWFCEDIGNREHFWGY